MAKKKTKKKKATKRKKNAFKPDWFSGYVPALLWGVVLGFLGNAALNEFPSAAERAPASKQAKKPASASTPSWYQRWNDGSEKY